MFLKANIRALDRRKMQEGPGTSRHDAAILLQRDVEMDVREDGMAPSDP